MVAYEKKMKFQIVHPDKILFPKIKASKKEIIEYYDDVSDKMLPFLKDRFLALQRFPDGVNKQGFFQKNTPDYYPNSIEEKKENETNYSICSNKECLLYLANQAAIVFHSWLSKKDRPTFPDKIVFDLDPIGVDFSYVRKGALALKKILEPELKTYIMTTGSKGLHVVAPIKREMNFEEVHEITGKIAELIAKTNTEKFTTEMRKEKREGKVFVDFHRNTHAQLSVVPYSLRSTENASIAMPIEWKDLKDFRYKKINPKEYISEIKGLKNWL